MSTEFVNAISSLPILAGRSICDQSGYVIDSAYQKASAMSSYALSAGVSGVIDTVSYNSADWNYDHDTLKTNSAGWDSCYSVVMDKSASWEDTKSAVSANSATWGQGGVDSATVSAIASSYAESAVSSKADSSALSSYALSSDVSGCIDTVSSNSASWSTTIPIYTSDGTNTAHYAMDKVSLSVPVGAGRRYSELTTHSLELNKDDGDENFSGVLLDTTSLAMYNQDDAGYVNISSIKKWNSAFDTVSSNSATWGQGGVDSATVSAIASSYVESGVSSKADSSALSSYALSSDVSSTIDTVANNSAYWGGGGATGDYYEKSATEIAYGTGASAHNVGLAIGGGPAETYAEVNSIAIGPASALSGSIAICINGESASANTNSVAIGRHLSAKQFGYAFGLNQTATGYAVAFGQNISSNGFSLAEGLSSTAVTFGVAMGYGVSATHTGFAIGQYNLHGNGNTSTGNSAAFVIGDGTANNARHDLMLVTKDGEITMFSSTADTTGTGIMSSIRAISAAATGGGGGAQVVTATGSASATATGYWPPIITSYLVSSINGSAILPYGFSTLSANSANWTSTNSAVSANSAYWNSAENTVYDNSAKWNSAYSLISGVTALMDAI